MTSAPALLQVFPPDRVVRICTEADLRGAMVAGGTVIFACDGTITLANTISISLDTVLDASGHRITISGNDAVQVFQVNTNVNFTLANLMIADGTSAGGSAILNLGGTVSLTGVALQANTATIGGAILNRGGTVNATNCSFVGNTVLGYPAQDQPLGGAIRNEAGQVALRSCAFMGNRASGEDSPGNSAKGGAIHNSDTATLDLYLHGQPGDRRRWRERRPRFWGHRGRRCLRGGHLQRGHDDRGPDHSLRQYRNRWKRRYGRRRLGPPK